MKKTKIQKVTECIHCPLLAVDEDGYTCQYPVESRAFYNAHSLEGGIPKRCPLRDHSLLVELALSE